MYLFVVAFVNEPIVHIQNFFGLPKLVLAMLPDSQVGTLVAI